MWLALEAVIASLPCDYECFAAHAQPMLYVYGATYWASYGMLEVIELYRGSGYITCPAPPP